MMGRRVGLALLLAALPLLAQAAGSLQVVDVPVGFDSARAALLQVLADHGLKLSEELDISEMLDRTGHDLGLGGALYGKAHAFGFCSAVLSRQLMQADPRNIVFCPFTIDLYTLPGKPAVTHLAWRPVDAAGTPASPAAAAAVNALLADIAGKTRAEAF